MTAWQKFLKFFGLYKEPVEVKTIPKQVADPKKDEKKRVKPAWKVEAEKHKGQVETNAKFSEWIRGKIKTFLGYKPPTIATSTYAWCGYFIVTCLGVTGYQYHKQGEMARNWGQYGNAIEWRTNGIPEGAIVWINHKFDCKSSSSNHVAMANGDCAPQDLKAGATIDLLGGNQQNAVRVSTYPVKEICGVRWPKEAEAPPKITKSINCTSGKSTGGSTR